MIELGDQGICPQVVLITAVPVDFQMLQFPWGLVLFEVKYILSKQLFQNLLSASYLIIIILAELFH